MKSVRKALRDKSLVKDTYERLNCAECEQTLNTKNDPDEIGTVRACPDCGGEWKEIR
ncbi:HVO_0758 family zinc finger protein [Haloarchaeobius sp. TZWWS8]|uniref:HVO_0758 family zinc finger protein n=1 Tax=Haloarchaeobius sp. TZWWS8 TaxID=3446121 RepID=UPI003EB8ABBC